MLCAGCGLPVSTGSGPGRPARYHNATCRQRARRARMATQHGDILAAVAAVESAASDIRHALLTNGDPSQAGHLLTQAVAELAQRLQLPRPASTPGPDIDLRVTKPVTTPDDQPHEASRPTLAPPVTQSVTEPATDKRQSPQRRARSARPAPLDLETVRQERSTDPVSPGWRILAGDTNAPIVVGFLEPVLSVTGRRSGRWQARRKLLTLVPGGPWRNRTDALVHLVDDYQHAATRVSRAPRR